MPRYEFSKGESNKFWQIKISDKSIVTTFGRIGTCGQSIEKSFPEKGKAREAYKKLIKEKLAKGYVLKGTKKTASAPKNPARDKAADPDALYRIIDGSDDLWSGCGSYLANGYAKRVAGTLEIIRTGPYLPALSFLNDGEMLVSERLRTALEEASLSGIAFKKTIKRKVVAIPWHTWDRSTEYPNKIRPKNLEFDRYFDRKHNPKMAKSMGQIFELIAGNCATITGTKKERKTILIVGKPGDLFRAAYDYGTVWVANARAKDLLEQQADSWIRFEPLKVTESSKETASSSAKKENAGPGMPLRDELPEAALRIAGPKEEWIYDVAFDAQNACIAVQLGNWLVQTWDLKKATQVSEDVFRGPMGKDKPAQLAIVPGTAGVAWHKGKLVGLRCSGRKELLFKDLGVGGCSVIDLGSKGDGFGVFSPDQQFFVWPTERYLSTVDLTTQKIHQVPWMGHSDYFRPVVDFNAEHIAIIQKGSIVWIETSTGTERWRHEVPTRPSSIFLMDAKRLFISGDDGWKIVTVADGKTVCSVEVGAQLKIKDVAYLGNDGLLVACSSGEDPNAVDRLAVWDSKSTTPSRIFKLDSGRWGRIDSLVWSFDGSWVGVVINYSNLLIWPSNAF